ncbi:MAG: hypothetical protein AABX53_02815 [Nanoarchaeota archaeon]
MNELLFGPLPYEAGLQIVAERVVSEKRALFPLRAMTVAVEGLSNTGKSTLAKRLEFCLNEGEIGTLFIEGDLFQKSREESMEAYASVLVGVANGRGVPDDFPSRVWNYGKMQTELLDPIGRFNESSDLVTALTMRNVLSEKKAGTEHDETYTLTRRTIAFIAGMYLRQLPQFDRVLFLDAAPETVIQRKIERTARTGVSRNPEVTRRMVSQIEVPAMRVHLDKNRVQAGLVLDTNDFERVMGYRLEGYSSPYY